MTDLIIKGSSSIAMTNEEIATADAMCNEIANMDNQVVLDITHTLYEGVYYRTLFLQFVPNWSIAFVNKKIIIISDFINYRRR